MNILIPHSWLLEHLETEAKPEEIQKYLSLSGPSVERIHDIEGEPVYDIEVTTNRVDSMSVRGIAREAAVILTQAGIPSKLKPLAKLPAFMTKPTASKNPSIPLPTIENNPELVSRVTCMVLSDIRHVSSPEWMQIRLKQIGVNVHDAIIDTTNYVTHDLGHPCHAFDYDKIMELGGLIQVVKASKGKKFTTLDNEVHETVGGEVVFENEKGEIIDLPGVKGTANSGITSSTKNVLFWIESVDPKAIRFASMTHAIRTVAAQLNEKGVDPELILPTFSKGIELFTSLAGAKQHNDTFTDIYPQKKKLPAVELPLARIDQYLGVNVDPNTTIKILESLGCQITLKGKRIKVEPPSWRPDIAIPEDIVEEIARIYGYHNLPSVLMAGNIPLNRPVGTNFGLEHETKILLANLGGNEVYTYSLIDEKKAAIESSFLLSKLEKQVTDLAKTHLKLKNPLTEDMVYLRRTIWTSHIWIINKQSPQFVFELANTYVPSTSSSSTLPVEELHLTLSSVRDARHLKGALDAVLASMHLPPVTYSVDSRFITNLNTSDAVIGQMLTMPDSAVSVIDLNWKTLATLARKYPMVKPIPKVSPIIEDMTFSFEQPMLVQDVIATVKATDKLISHVEFKDMFKSNLTFTVYYQPEEEMNTSQIAPYRKKIAEALSDKYKASIVGKL